MDPLEPENRPPRPPRAIPPAPPPQALLKPNIPHVPLTPMMEFLQRRLEGMEKELAVERERAQAANSMLQQQEGLRSQVELQLKAMTDTLRREKAERESEETKVHARGRIDALEKRLDEMHQSWVTLLREAMTQRESTHSAVSASQDVLATSQGAMAKEQAGLKQEIIGLQGAMQGIIEQIGNWRVEARSIVDVLPELKGLAAQLPADERRFEGQISQMLAHFSADLRDRVAAWERRQSLEMEKHEERMQAFSREKAGLLQALEEQNHQLRQESLKEKLQREAQTGDQVAALARHLNDLRVESAGSKAALERVLEIVAKPPQAKEHVIQALEGEKEQLLRALKERSEGLQSHIEQRREVERTMGESLMALTREIDESNAKQQTLSSRISELELGNARLADELQSAKRAAFDKDERRQALEAERDQISKSLLAEAEKARLLIEDRSRADDSWAAKLTALQSRLSAEIDGKTREAAAAAELRGQIMTLSEHLARALQERDAVSNRHSSWEQERAGLLKRLQEKEEMITMLNGTFQRMLKPGND